MHCCSVTVTHSVDVEKIESVFLLKTLLPPLVDFTLDLTYCSIKTQDQNISKILAMYSLLLLIVSQTTTSSYSLMQII